MLNGGNWQTACMNDVIAVQRAVTFTNVNHTWFAKSEKGGPTINSKFTPRANDGMNLEPVFH